ncbi:hypothetical protein DFH94DRAFT_778313 [Russula ochroleuca]|uniref:Uncharacterized protein n=1 Tax=Russula ochroleuca TaxID=152965 RepID=A0A9P5JWQ0_9AGAM|nr:hypothetical protein DFH94DRAFT_778313 [Russula ochroleuca]
MSLLAGVLVVHAIPTHSCEYSKKDIRKYFQVVLITVPSDGYGRLIDGQWTGTVQRSTEGESIPVRGDRLGAARFERVVQGG